MFFGFLTSKSIIRIISFICSYNIAIVIFRGKRFIIRKKLTIFVTAVIILVVVIIVIIIIVTIINAVKNITRTVIVRNIRRSVTSFMRNIIIVTIIVRYTKIIKVIIIVIIALVIIIIIIITVIIINAFKNIARIIIVRNVRRTVTSFTKNVIIITIIVRNKKIFKVIYSYYYCFYKSFQRLPSPLLNIQLLDC